MLTMPEFEALRDRTDLFESVATANPSEGNLTSVEDMEAVVRGVSERQPPSSRWPSRSAVPSSSGCWPHGRRRVVMPGMRCAARRKLQGAPAPRGWAWAPGRLPCRWFCLLPPDYSGRTFINYRNVTLGFKSFWRTHDAGPVASQRVRQRRKTAEVIGVTGPNPHCDAAQRIRALISGCPMPCAPSPGCH